MTEIYKILNIVPPILKSLFQFRISQYNLRNLREFSAEKRNTVNFGTETLTYSAPAIWAKLPTKYMHETPLDEFKSKIKSWECEICPCRLCKNYQPNLGYIK